MGTSGLFGSGFLEIFNDKCTRRHPEGPRFLPGGTRDLASLCMVVLPQSKLAQGVSTG